MNSYGKLVVIGSILIAFYYLVFLHYWTTSSQDDIPKVRPCHRKDCSFLLEPEKTVEAKKEKENSQGTVEITSVLTPVHKHNINRVSLSLIRPGEGGNT